MDYGRPVDRDSDSESTNLGLEIASAAAATGRASAIPLLPDADNMVVLPEGTTLDDVAVRGRDLVIEAEGKTYIIPDGAIFVPVLVVDGVAVPPLNLAAYLNESQPQPAAGNPQSSGGNFFDPADPIQPAYGLGNLLPYTELTFPEEEDEEVFAAINNEPEITFIPRIGEVSSGTRVEEAGLASSTVVRDSESPGSQDESDLEITANTIDFISLDGVDTVTINGVVIDPGGLPQVVSSDEIGTLIITGYAFDDATKTGSITYEYTLGDNTLDPGGSEVSFPIVVTDPQGDVAEDILAIEIVDDVPTAVEDFDSVSEGGTATGNVLPNDEFGADGPATTTPEGGVIGVRAADGDTETPVETGTGTEIRGLYGTLVLNADGSYTYKSDPNLIDTDVVDVFVYTIEDGDEGEGDISTTTLTIDISAITLVQHDVGVVVDEAALDLNQDGADLAPGDTTGRMPASTDETVAGTVVIAGAAAFEIVGSSEGTYGVISIDNDGNFTYTLTTRFDNLPHADDGTETQPAGDVFTYLATDANGNTVEGIITVDIIDDIPVATADVDTVSEGGTAVGNVLPNDAFGADGPATTAPLGGVIGVRKADGDTTTEVTTGTGTEIVGDYGTLILNADGGYTYVTAPGTITEDVVEIFVYTIEDDDGDRSTTTLTITVDDVTLVADEENVTVFEPSLDLFQTGDDLAPGIVTGSVPGNTLETVSGALDVPGATSFAIVGSATGTYGLIQINADGSYTYTLTTPVDNLPHANDGHETEPAQEIFTYQASDDNGNVIEGTITVDIVDDVPIARSDFNSVDEFGTVLGNVLPNDSFGADGPDVTSPAGGVVGVRAAGGDTTSPVTTGTGAVIAGLYGTLTLNADGSYSYQAGSVVADVQDVFVYSIRDSDGDLSTTTLTILVGDTFVPPPDDAPSGGLAYALVDDDGLPAGNPNSTVNDLDTNEGQDQTPTTTDDDADGLASSEASFSGTLNFSPGTDIPVAVSFDVTTGDTDTVGTETVEYTVTANVLLATVTGGDRDGTDLFRVTITDTVAGEYTVELLDNVLHATRDGEADDDTENLTANDATVTIGFDVVDNNGSPSVTPVQLTIIFDDDAPSSFVVAAADLENSVDGTTTGSLDAAPGDGNILNNIGADGGSVIFDPSLDGADSGLKSGLQPIVYDVSVDGQTLEGKVGANTVFTISIDQANSQYTITMDETYGTVDSTSQVDYNDGAFDLVGGNGAWFGIVPDGQGDGGGDSPVDDDSQDILITPLTSDTINTSNILGGVGSGQDVDPGEAFRIDYVVDLTGSPLNSNYVLGDPNTHSFDEHWTTNGATVSFRQSTSGTTMRFEAFDDEGTDDANNIVGDGDQEAITNIVIFYNNDESTLLTPTGSSQNVSVGGETFGYQLSGQSVLVTNVTGANGASSPELTTTIAIYTADGYTTLEITNEDPLDGGNSIKFGGFAAAVETENPVEFSVPLLIMDADGDKTATSDLDITLTPVSEEEDPIVLDLDGDGVEFLSQDAGVAFDYGAGLVATAWAGADDGLLARQTAQGLDIVFTDDAPGAATDLEGVREAYDGNGDGVLTSADAAWGDFGVWQDADSDGVNDAGEFRSLDDLGIVSIELTSDGEGYSAAGSDVTVHGEAAFTTAGGATGVLADASFAVGAQKIETRSLEFTNAAIAAGVMASALLIEAPEADAKGPVTTGTPSQDVPKAAQSGTVSNDGGEDVGTSSLIYIDDASGELAGSEGSASSDDSDGEMSDEGMADLIDHYSGDAGNDSSSESVVEASGDLVSGSNSDGGDVMQGLLLLTQVTPVEDASGDLDYLGEAIVEAEGENFVDQLIDDLGSGDSDGEADSGDGSIDGLQLLLATDVDSAPVVGQGSFEFNDMAEELNAAAAAA